MASVALDGVGKRFAGDVDAVRDLSLVVDEGEFVVLVGPSGCGKSTTLRLVAGLEEPTSGSVIIDGECVNDVPAGRRDVAMVFQSAANLPHLSVADNIAFGLRLRGVGRAEGRRRAADVAAVVGITELLDRRPSDLSGGQRQRVAIARAMVREPKAFLMDEPLSSLDARLRVQMRSEIAALHRRLGTTTIYVTHDQAEAMSLGDRVAVMRDGAIEQVAAPTALYDRPATAFVAAFIGDPPMNLLNGRVADGNVVIGDVAVPVGRSLEDGLPVTVGIRPTDLALTGGGGLAGSIATIDHRGADLVAYVTVPGADGMVAVVLPAGTALTAGAPVSLAAQPDRVHLFAIDTGVRIEPPRPLRPD